MLIAVLLPVLAAPPAYAKTHIVSASIFKNDYALVTRRIDVPASGAVLLDVLPRSTLATLWFESSGGLQMRSITASDVIVERSSPIGDTLALLQANVGKKVTLTFSGNRPSVTGKIISVSTKITLLDEGGATGAYGTDNIVHAVRPSAKDFGQLILFQRCTGHRTQRFVIPCAQTQRCCQYKAGQRLKRVV